VYPTRLGDIAAVLHAVHVPTEGLATVLEDVELGIIGAGVVR
jgi:hypothetical protein